MDASSYYAQTLDNPVRRHEAQGIGAEPSRISEAASLALEFVNDCCDAEAYGHALPAEVVKRAGRIRAMLRPEPPRCGIGYEAPPPARCAKCDDE